MDSPLNTSDVPPILLPAARAEVEPSEAMDALGDEAADAILKIGGRLLGRRFTLSGEAKQSEALIRQIGGRPEPIDQPNPLEPVEDDPTRYIRKFEQEQEVAEHLDRVQRSFARRRRSLLKRERALTRRVEEALATQGDASLGDSTDRHHQSEFFPSFSKALRHALGACRTTLARDSWLPVGVERIGDAGRRARLKLLVAAIERIRDARLRASLRSDLSDFVGLAAGQTRADRSALALASVSAAPIQAAGGKTDRFAPRD